ncbi:MAG: UDP-glucose 6-dehydrogenase [Deltaproteobacteria bacterium HGW-Deltaproteobacteria-17]|nr:MAG: UDP-glucose 6-dehydrogenase [Deltaproteobacteria bacterium HGW-Deltaproteobacteria-17]
MQVCVIGTGYVGLVAGAAFADFGNTVHCVDIDEKKIQMLWKGEIPIYEPGLDVMVARNVEKKRLIFSTDLPAAVKNVQVVFLAVGTPQGDDGNADLSALKAAAEVVAKNINGFTVIVDKSTVPVGTADVIQDIFNRNSTHEAVVVSNPEFLKEGDAINDFMRPERVVIGTSDERARRVMHELYQPFVRSRERIIDMDTRSAELTKYASNAFLATRISFMNNVARLCEIVGADVELVRKGMGSDSRIGPKFLYAGTGYGGSCFPKDISALLYLSHQVDQFLDVVEATSSSNERQKRILVEKMERRLGDLKGKVVAVLGLAFKPNTDDIREAPAKVIVELLEQKGAIVRAYDPVAMDNFKASYPANTNRAYFDNLYDTVEGADATCLVTEWHEFQRPDFARIRKAMRGNSLFDGRNVWNTQEIRENGFYYEGIGRPIIRPE